MTALASGRQREPGPRQEQEVLGRLRKAAGQLSGVAGMYEDGRYCIDILDQLAAVNAALDAVALLVLTDHINTCVSSAIAGGDPDAMAAELAAGIRRYVRTR